MNGLGNDYYDSQSRSPPRARSTNTQTLNRHTGRPTDLYATMQDSIYSNDEPSSRYDPSRFHDRMSSGMQNFGGLGGGASGAGYDMGPAQAWNSSGFSQNNHLAALGATTRGKPSGRSGLPSVSFSPLALRRQTDRFFSQLWLDQPAQMHAQGNFGGFGGASLGYKPMRSDQLNAEGDDELIPTAIVIKNIPFAVKKEQLVQVMTEMNLPLPYAFNYHFDNGVFRGLAFANFTTPDETAAVITAMNHLELHGRKLRVEYKKMLPQAERDRIEREKRERRGQLEEQHRPMANSQLNNQPSLSSVGSHVNAASPSPLSGRPGEPALDMNDPLVLRYYSQLILFQGDPAQGDVLAFTPDLPSTHRTVIHGLSHRLGLHHESHGSGNERRVHVYRAPAGNSPVAGGQQFANDPNRRVLNRAATTDFSSVRHNEPSLYGGPASQSSGFLGFSDNQNGLSVASNLRTAKSFADLRSYTPSPAQSTNSFPANLAPNLARFQDYAPGSPGSQRSNVTPTTTSMPESIINGMNTMNLEHGFAPRSGSPQRVRGMVSWERDNREAMPGPIGGHRQYSGGHDDPSRNRSSGSMRQNRNPMQDRGSNFARPRQNGHQQRGSDEMSSPSNVEIVVE